MEMFLEISETSNMAIRIHGIICNWWMAVKPSKN